MPQFYTLLTDTGQAKIANAVALGTQIEITQMAVGDGGGNPVTPNSSATTLVNEVRRAPINAVQTDDDNPTWIVIEQVLPPDVGGWTIREVGVFDTAGDLIATGNLPETYKPVLAEGSSRTQTIRVVMEVSDTAAVTLRVDPSVVLATREYVDSEIDKHEQSRNHPAATESAQGMIQRATSAQAKAGSDNTRAMTPERAHEAFSQFGIGTYSGYPWPNGSDLNDVEAVKSGIYSNYFSSVSTLDGWPDSSSSVNVIISLFHESSNRVFQRLNFVRKGGVLVPKVYERSYYNGAWSKWVERPESSAIQFMSYDAGRTYTTGEVTRGSDGQFYEFYDRDQVGTVEGVDPIDVGNRPHIWMEWHGVRPGTVVEWRSEVLPEGYIENDGAAISRSDYRRIFNVLGITHGAGDGSTTFNLPDDRGIFKRGWDNGRGIDSGRSLSSFQGDDFKSHSHQMDDARNVTSFDPTGGYLAVTIDDQNKYSGQGISSAIRYSGGSETRPKNNAAIYLTKI
ncbi:MAG: hypothetical protein CME82_04910 [Halomonas sp.]|nr:hypothetical protein [Halomonas sp.]|tara:strand:- start:224 stop:1750 length:1527 start_codon:yes stop_codon:yes gene_type:complete